MAKSRRSTDWVKSYSSIFVDHLNPTATFMTHVPSILTTEEANDKAGQPRESVVVYFLKKAKAVQNRNGIFEEVLAALRKSEQDFIAKMLTHGNVEEYSQKASQHKRLIKELQDTMVVKIHPTDMIPHLGCLSREEINEIFATIDQHGVEKGTLEMLSYLLLKGDEMPGQLLTALQKNKNPGLARKLVDLMRREQARCSSNNFDRATTASVWQTSQYDKDVRDKYPSSKPRAAASSIRNIPTADGEHEESTTKIKPKTSRARPANNIRESKTKTSEDPALDCQQSKAAPKSSGSSSGSKGRQTGKGQGANSNPKTTSISGSVEKVDAKNRSDCCKSCTRSGTCKSSGGDGTTLFCQKCGEKPASKVTRKVVVITLKIGRKQTEVTCYHRELLDFFGGNGHSLSKYSTIQSLKEYMEEKKTLRFELDGDGDVIKIMNGNSS